MGADLLGYMLAGPVEIRENRDKAIKKAMETVEKCKAIEDPDPCEDFEINENILSGAEVESIALMEEAEVEEFVNEFINCWESDGCFGRDSTSRVFSTCCDHMRVSFAGGMSWGDEPEGLGYTMLKQACLLGVAEALELE